jgi:quercetin dioxygenase-like cupin family protein
MAEDSVKVAPDVYKVVFENEKVRVLEVEMEEGSGTEMHSHPDTLIYILSGGKVTFTDPSGEVVDLETSDGETVWMEATEHATQHVSGAVRALLIEPK